MAKQGPGAFGGSSAKGGSIAELCDMYAPVINGEQHMAAFITPREAQVLRRRGGGVTADGGQQYHRGIPAFGGGDNPGGETGRGEGDQAGASDPGRGGYGGRDRGGGEGGGGGPAPYGENAPVGRGRGRRGGSSGGTSAAAQGSNSADRGADIGGYGGSDRSRGDPGVAGVPGGHGGRGASPGEQASPAFGGEGGRGAAPEDMSWGAFYSGLTPQQQQSLHAHAPQVGTPEFAEAVNVSRMAGRVAPTAGAVARGIAGLVAPPLGIPGLVETVANIATGRPASVGFGMIDIEGESPQDVDMAGRAAAGGRADVGGGRDSSGGPGGEGRGANDPIRRIVDDLVNPDTPDDVDLSDLFAYSPFPGNMATYGQAGGVPSHLFFPAMAREGAFG